MSLLCGCCSKKVDEQVDHGRHTGIQQQFNTRVVPKQELKRGPASSRKSVYFDASQGVLAVPDVDNDLYFFDAQTNKESEESSVEDPYVAITTNYIKAPPRKMSILEPTTLLSSRTKIAEVLQTEGSEDDDEEEEPEIVVDNNHFVGKPPTRRATIVTRESLEHPSVRIVERGYPGELTLEEVEECQQFYKEIKQRKGVYEEIVYSCSDVEQEPYTLCRFVRATKFDADKMLAQLEDEEFAERWQVAKKADFYPDIGKAIGCPMPTILSQYHFLYCGNAKDGCPVSYMKTDSINTEGLLCLMTVKDTPKFFWHSFVHLFIPLLQKALDKDPNYVRCEAVSVVDLSGASSSQLNADATEVIKHMTSIADYFPETLHCMVIVNAASWFSFAWRIIKRFIDPRTARKIEVYSSGEKGRARLLELIDEGELPSDFGGSAPSTGQQIQRIGRAPEDRTIRQIVKLIHLKRASDCSSVELKLEPDEIMTIRVFTRSICTASFSILGHNKHPVVKGQFVKKGDAKCTPPKPCCTELASNIKGTKIIEASAMETILREHKAAQLLFGYFLVVADVSKAP